MKLKLLLIICLAGLFPISCKYQVKNFQNVPEFQHEGFINSNIYQAIITSQPEKDIAGHVNQRDSAYMNARKILTRSVAENLAKYCIDKKTSGRSASIYITKESESNLKEKLYKYVNYGKIIYEYYNEDNSVVLGFRIEKNGLKSEIEALPIDLK